MRLIDADELKKDDEVTMWLSKDPVRTGKQLRMFSEYFINKIDNMPTVQAIPIEVLDKIRAEIEKVFCISVITDRQRTPMEVKTEILQIIDKYKAESEDKE